MQASYGLGPGWRDREQWCRAFCVAVDMMAEAVEVYLGGTAAGVRSSGGERRSNGVSVGVDSLWSDSLTQ